MSRRSGSTLGLVWTILKEAREREVSFLAAAVAFYAFVSIPPLLLLALVAATAVGGDELADLVVQATRTYLSPTGQDLLVEAILNAQGQTVAGVVSVALLLWSGLRLFRGLDEAFAQVYEPVVEVGFLDKMKDAVVVLLTIAIAVVGVVALGGIVPSLLAELPFTEVLSLLAIVPMLMAVFFPIYYFFPDVHVEPREALPGAAFTAVGWTLLTVLFRIYAENAASYRVYGILGLVILLVTWLYFASTIIILGAVVNAVLTGRRGGGESGEETADDAEAEPEPTGPAPDISALERELREVQTRLEEKTVSRSELEGELRAYVRRRVRRGHARGWGPYLVLLYGTLMTLGAFYFLDGPWSILAMLVVWLSTLGLYVLMLVVGVGVGALGVPGRAIDWVRSRRS